MLHKVTAKEGIMVTDRTREQLLSVALRYFAEKGFKGTSVRDICQKAKANVSAIKYHFGSKEELYRACFKSFGESRLNSASLILKPAKSKVELEQNIALFCNDFIINSLENIHLFKMIMREIEAENPLIQDIVQDSFIKIHSTFVSMLDEAKKSNLIKNEIDTLIATSTVFNTLTTSLRLDHVAKKNFNLTLHNQERREKYIQQLVLIITNGIFNQEHSS